MREGASADLLAVINHVVARDNRYQGRVNGRVNVTVAMLERDFTVSGNLIERDKSGTMRLGTFDLSHETYGKLLSVDGEGNVTLYDQKGGAMGATAYETALLGSDSVFKMTSNRPRAGLIDQHNGSGAMRLGAFEPSQKAYGKLLPTNGGRNAPLSELTGGAMDATAYVNALFGSDSVFRIAANSPHAGLIDQRLYPELSL